MSNSPYFHKAKATKCICCGRYLEDPDSVEVGIGPVCRKRYGYGHPSGTTNYLKAKLELRNLNPELKDFILDVPKTKDRGKDIYAIAKKLVYNISALGSGVNADLDAVKHMTNALRYLGYIKLADKITDKIVAVKFVRNPENSEVDILTSYNPVFIAEIKKLPYKDRRFVKDTKAWAVKYGSAAAAYDIVKRVFAGKIAYSEKEGLFNLN